MKRYATDHDLASLRELARDKSARDPAYAVLAVLLATPVAEQAQFTAHLREGVDWPAILAEPWPDAGDRYLVRSAASMFTPGDQFPVDLGELVHLQEGHRRTWLAMVEAYLGGQPPHRVSPAPQP